MIQNEHTTVTEYGTAIGYFVDEDKFIPKGEIIMELTKKKARGYIMSTDIKELPKINKLYLKEWQSNNYYPICIAEKINNGWKRYYLSVSGEKRCASTYTDKAFLYLLQNNLFMVTDKLTNKFNDVKIWN